MKRGNANEDFTTLTYILKMCFPNILIKIVFISFIKRM